MSQHQLIPVPLEGKQGQRDKEETEAASVTCKTRHPTMMLILAQFIQKQRSGSTA